MKSLLKRPAKENTAGNFGLAVDEMHGDGSPFSIESPTEELSLASHEGVEDESVDSSQVPPPIEEAVQQAETSEVVVSIVETPYGRKEEERFHELVILRASKKATEEHQKEFAVLQEARREALQPNSTDSILNEYRRQQFFIDALQVLQRHARFLEPANQTRVRSFR
jgi:hypothetical protein